MGKLFVKVVITGLVLAAVYDVPVSADTDFEQWMQQQAAGVSAQKKAFQEYRDKRDREFTDFLKAQWKPVDIVAGDVRDEVPKPAVMPVATPETVAVPVDAPLVALLTPEPESIIKPVVAPVVAAAEGESIMIDFFGRKIRFSYDADLNQRLGSGLDERAVSDYWSVLSRTAYEDVLKQLTSQKKSLQLNDWAYASLVHQLSAGIAAHRKNDTALLSWFLLVKSGYKARVAYDESAVYLLIPSRHELFEVSYFSFGGERFYAIDFDGIRKKPGQVFTYDGEYPDANNKFNMQVTPVVASNDKLQRRHLSFMFEGRQYNIEVAYDQGRVKFFNSYPQLNLSLYFSSEVYAVTATPLQQQLAVSMKAMSEQQAVNFLLRFVQTSLKYETDEQQFGEENYLFPEETLFYPYSDCEDRAVLFAWLVRSLLGLEVIGLDYPGHVATAVYLGNEIAGDSVRYQGQSYMVADPTYINATVGMTMPDFKKFKPTVIAY